MSRLVLRSAVAIAVFVACSLASTAAQNAPASAASAPYAGATISGWTRQVHLELPGHSLSVPSRGERLPAGTLLDTQDGILVLLLEDESQIILRPHTRLVLKQPGAGDWSYFEILVGRVRAFIKKRTGGAPPFQLGTPSAVIAVRGTRFDVEVNSHSVTEVDVFQGLVEVAGAGIRGSSVLVGPGFSTRVGLGSPPESPIRTDEIRPGALASDRSAQAEFFRERRVELFNSLANEMNERSSLEINELENQAEETLEGSSDPD